MVKYEKVKGGIRLVSTCKTMHCGLCAYKNKSECIGEQNAYRTMAKSKIIRPVKRKLKAKEGK